MAYAKTVEEYISKHPDRIEELQLLRSVIMNLPFTETIKWGMPTYTLDGKNIVGFGGFKNWSCLWFHQGGLLSDPNKVLVNAQEGKTKALRQWRFQSLEAIKPDLVNKYLKEAISIHKSGKSIPPNSNKKKLQTAVPQFLLQHFERNKQHQILFEKYSIAQRNAFIEYINEAKRISTKESRLQKIIKLWKEGKKLTSLWGG